MKSLGMEITSKEEQDSMEHLLEEQHSCLPVFLSEEVAHSHYNGFSNR
jgi:trehalose 6-phosphate synthase/phosphatase